MLCRPDAPFCHPTLPSSTTLPPDRTALLPDRESYDQKKNFIPSSVTNIKPRHEIVYKIPSNDNNKGDVKFNKEEETEPNPTMPNSNPIEDNSPTISPFPKDSTMHIPYTDANTFADVVLLNHVGEKEFKSIVSDGIRVVTTKNIKKNDMGLSKEPAIEWNMGRKIDE
ncbi:hypothetical protein Tco_1532389 [Tanacetum coccineum]